MISKLHHITQDLPDRSHEEQALLTCQGGADWIQLRLKERSAEEMKIIAYAVKKICQRFGAKLVLNDHVELAKAVGADGVHLGKEDMSPVLARQLLGAGYIIGGTANSWEDVVKLAEQKLSYIGLGPYRFTTTKEKLSPALGLAGYQRIMDLCRSQGIYIPIVAIGGLLAEDIPGLLEAGVYGAAVAGAINKTTNPEKSVAAFLEALNRQTTGQTI